ncbi:uncharacterized protein LOC144710652 isoform X2 [Wolffia australiana]
MGTSEFQRSPRSEKKEVERSKISSAQLHHADIVEAFLGHLGKSRELPGSSQEAQFSVKLIRSAMKLEAAERGRVIFSLIVLPQLTNLYNTLHGGAIGVIAEQVAQACVMTVSNDEFFLGESNVSCLSASKINNFFYTCLEKSSCCECWPFVIFNSSLPWKKWALKDIC